MAIVAVGKKEGEEGFIWSVYVLGLLVLVLSLFSLNSVDHCSRVFMLFPGLILNSPENSAVVDFTQFVFVVGRDLLVNGCGMK